MAEQLDNMPVKMGYLIRVRNTRRLPSESEDYYAVKLEDQSGDNERWCLFTGAEVARLTEVELHDGIKESDRKPGRIYYRHRTGKYFRGFVRLCVPPPEASPSIGKVFRTVSISCRLVDKGQERARKNPEDVPKMSWLEDLRD